MLGKLLEATGESHQHMDIFSITGWIIGCLRQHINFFFFLIESSRLSMVCLPHNILWACTYLSMCCIITFVSRCDSNICFILNPTLQIIDTFEILQQIKTIQPNVSLYMFTYMKSSSIAFEYKWVERHIL